MGSEFQEIIDKDNLEDARMRMIEFNKRQFQREIEADYMKHINEIKDSFLENNEDLSRQELSLVNRVFDFISNY